MDKNGFPEPLEPGERTVYADRKSVGYSEFYKAQLAGYEVALKFDVHAAEYHGETLAEYGGKRYQVLRTYAKDGDTLELTLSDVRQKKEAVSPG